MLERKSRNKERGEKLEIFKRQKDLLVKRGRIGLGDGYKANFCLKREIVIADGA